MTATDRAQRAFDWIATDLDELHSLRLEVRDTLAASPPDSPLRHVMPWLWQTASTGEPMTDAAKATGFELRFSRYRTPLY